MNTLLNLGKNRSADFKLNFVANDGIVFLMDNHLAALWCWLQIIDPNNQYNIFHIDRHLDLFTGSERHIVSELNRKGLSIKDIPIEKLTQEQFHFEKVAYQSFTWDNYFSTLTELYPNVLDAVFFATHREGYGQWGKEYAEKEIYSLPDNLRYWIESETEKSGRKWIVNVDIDYFFLPNRYREEDDVVNPATHYQFLSDAYVANVAEEITRSREHIEVLTIALSPECCGGWENAIRVGKIFVKQLGLKFPKI